MDIKVLDHLIITDQSYFSFADQGRIWSFSLPLWKLVFNVENTWRNL